MSTWGCWPGAGIIRGNGQSVYGAGAALAGGRQRRHLRVRGGGAVSAFFGWALYTANPVFLIGLRGWMRGGKMIKVHIEVLEDGSRKP